MRVLFLTHRLPYAPNRGDRVRAYHLLHELSRSFDVDLISLAHDGEEASHAKEIAPVVASVEVVRVTRLRNFLRGLAALPTRRPLTHVLLDAPDLTATVSRVVAKHAPDVVLAYCSGMARLALAPPLNRFPLVVDMVDVDSAKWAALAGRSAPPRSWIYAREARCLSAFEALAARHARSSVVVTERERESLHALAPDAAITVIPNGIDVDGFRPAGAIARQKTVVFCGVMNYPPNEEAAVWLARDIWPLVRQSHPDAGLVIVGSEPSPIVRKLADARSNVTVTGSVPDVRPFLWSGAIAVAPLQTARGVQNKVLEAVAAGLPVVVTPVVFDGLPLEVAPACQVAGTTSSFAEAMNTLLAEPSQQRQVRMDRVAMSGLAWSNRLQPFATALQSAAAI